MKIKDLNSEDAKTSPLDFENFFEVYEDRRGNYSYNINSNLYLDVSGANLQVYIPTHDLHPTIVSYNIYGTPRLAWLICKLNGISDPSIAIETGTPLFYVPKEQLGGLVQYMGS